MAEKEKVSNPFFQSIEGFQAYQPKIEQAQQDQVDDLVEEEIKAGNLPPNIKYQIARGD